MRNTPLTEIERELNEIIPTQLISLIPYKWEKLGDVLVFKLDSKLDKYREVIAEKYAKVLNCKSVLNDIGGITGIYRKPNFELIYGSENTETTHIENKIRYKLDPKKIMFSSGNMDERIRMSKIKAENEVVVDLFAGIGYFSLPIAIYTKVKKIYSCEINPLAFKYLCENITLNHVTKKMDAIFGDNRKTAPQNIANRVVMGYIEKTYKYLQIAINCLKDSCGIIHYHDVFPKEDVPKIPLKIVGDIAQKNKIKIKMLKQTRIKSYAPGINHFVFDLKIGDT